jgi:hypothetical protein
MSAWRPGAKDALATQFHTQAWDLVMLDVKCRT